MATKKFNYNEAIQSIEQSLERFRNEELDVDTLSEEVKRASTLIASCRERLTKVEEEVNKIRDAE